MNENCIVHPPKPPELNFNDYSMYLHDEFEAHLLPKSGTLGHGLKKTCMCSPYPVTKPAPDIHIYWVHEG